MEGFFYRVYNAKVSSLSYQKTIKSEQPAMSVLMLPFKCDGSKFASKHYSHIKDNLVGLMDEDHKYVM